MVRGGGDGGVAVDDADDELAVVVASRAQLQGESAAVFLERVRSDEVPASAFRRAPVDAGGSAELPLPDNLVEPVLLVDGRYLYLERPFELEAGATSIRLQPELGSLVQVELVSAPGDTPSGSLRLMGGDMRGGRGGFSSREQPLRDPSALEFRAVDSNLSWSIQPRFDAHHGDMRMGLELEPGRALRVELPVLLGARVAGVVVDETGSPVAGAAVSIDDGMPWGRMFGAGRETTSAEDGRFEMRGVSPGLMRVAAELEGHIDARTEELEFVDGGAFTDVRLELSRGLTIAGVVLDPESQAASGAEVVVERLVRQNWGGFGGTSRLQRAGRASADAEGRFAISGLEEGSYTVRASLEDELAQTSARAMLERVEAGGPEVALDLMAPLGFEGVVLDDLGEPVTAFRLRVESVEDGGPTERQAFENEEGRFRFARVGPGSWEVRAEAAGYIQPEPVELALPDGGGELTLTLLRTASVSGVVLDSTGAPVAGASVRGGDGSSSSFGGGPPWGRDRGPRAETDAEGRFALDDLQPGSFELHAQAEGWADSEALRMELIPGQVREELVLALRVGGRIEGQVLTPEGDPIAGQRVTWGDNAMGFGSRGDTTSNATGNFSFEHVTPGEWTVSAVPSFEEFGESMRGGGQSGFMDVMGKMITERVVVEDGAVVEVYLGGEPRMPVRVYGRVTRSGEPLAGAQVVAVSEGSAVFEGMKSARTAADGAYEIVLDRPGPHTISASLDQVGVEEVLVVPREAELQLDLRIPLGRIEGRVFEPDGSPAAGLRMSIEREDGLGRIRWSGAQQSTDAEGRYAFSDLEAGRYSVRANSSGFGGGTNERFGTNVQSGLVVPEDQTLDGVDFELVDPGGVSGLVLGSDGQPLQGASIYFRDASGRLISRVSRVVTDAGGRFEKEGLSPGSYTLSARTLDQAAGDEVSVNVVAGQTADVRITLDTGVMLVVTLEDEDGEARRARIQVIDSEGRDVGGLVTREAMMAIFNAGTSTLEQRIGPIPPDRYTVRATLADGRSAERRVRVRDRGEDQRVVLKLEG